MKCLKPDVAESYHGVWVVTGRRSLEDTLKLLLTRPPLLLRQVKVADQRPCVGVILASTPVSTHNLIILNKGKAWILDIALLTGG